MQLSSSLLALSSLLTLSAVSTCAVPLVPSNPPTTARNYTQSWTLTGASVAAPLDYIAFKKYADSSITATNTAVCPASCDKSKTACSFVNIYQYTSSAGTTTVRCALYKISERQGTATNKGGQLNRLVDPGKTSIGQSYGYDVAAAALIPTTKIMDIEDVGTFEINSDFSNGGFTFVQGAFVPSPPDGDYPSGHGAVRATPPLDVIMTQSNGNRFTLNQLKMIMFGATSASRLIVTPLARANDGSLNPSGGAQSLADQLYALFDLPAQFGNVHGIKFSIECGGDPCFVTIDDISVTFLAASYGVS